MGEERSRDFREDRRDVCRELSRVGFERRVVELRRLELWLLEEVLTDGEVEDGGCAGGVVEDCGGGIAALVVRGCSSS